MNRRLALAAICSLLAMTGCQAPPTPRSVLVIVVDTLRADHLGVYGHQLPTSPQIDAWAESGIVFERAYSTSPWTLPSVASLLTGKRPRTHGAGQLTDRGGRAELADGVASVAEAFSAAGWSTGAIVANPHLSARFGLDRGFATYDDSLARQPWTARRAETVIERAMGWLEKHAEERFFLLVHLIDPHLSYDPPSPFRGAFTNGEASSRNVRLGVVRTALAAGDSSRLPFLAAAYDEEIAYVDSQLGRLREFLRNTGLDRSTLVVLTSDHGEEFGEHGSFEHGHTLFDEVLRVPLIIWHPAFDGERRRRAVSLQDLAATLLDATGASPASGWGQSLLGSRSGDAPLVAESTLYGEQQQAVISPPWKLILGSETGSVQLFRLDRDPAESINLAAEHPKIVTQLSATLGSDSGAAGDRPPVKLDEAARRELEALGYLQ